MRWINEEQARYDEVHLVRDLFGEWTLIACWGALGSRRGGLRRTGVGVASDPDGLAQMTAIGKRRRRRGYVSVMDHPARAAG
jgi:hypothetical protein